MLKSLIEVQIDAIMWCLISSVLHTWDPNGLDLEGQTNRQLFELDELSLLGYAGPEALRKTSDSKPAPKTILKNLLLFCQSKATRSLPWTIEKNQQLSLKNKTKFIYWGPTMSQ